MRLICETLVLNRNCSNSTNSKHCKGVVTILRESKSKPIKLRVSRTSKPAFDFSLNDGNISTIFSKMVNNGMITIRFQTPPSDLMISKADPVQLAAFLKTLKAAASGEDLPWHTFSCSQQASDAVANISGPSKLKITQRRDYPFWTPIASTVEQLHVENCQLTEFDSRLLKLKHLTHLILIGNDFSNGRLDAISLSAINRLTNLDLSQNRIDRLDDQFGFRLPPNLKQLSLASNFLTTLPDSIFEFGSRCGLASLDLSRNRLSSLNKNIFKIQSTLKRLIVCNNELTFLPAGVAKLRLDLVDFSGNPFADVGQVDIGHMDQLGLVTSLAEFATRAIVEHGLPLSWLPPTLHPYLQHASTLRCDVCRHASLPSKARTDRFKLDLRRVSSTVIRLNRQSLLATVEGVCCSSKCASLFQRGRI